MMYLIYVVISAAPEENPLDRKYWDKWMLPFWTVALIFWIVDGARDAKTNGWWWPIALAATPILLIGVALVIRRIRQRQ